MALSICRYTFGTNTGKAHQLRVLQLQNQYPHDKFTCKRSSILHWLIAFHLFEPEILGGGVGRFERPLPIAEQRCGSWIGKYVLSPGIIMHSAYNGRKLVHLPHPHSSSGETLRRHFQNKSTSTAYLFECNRFIRLWLRTCGALHVLTKCFLRVCCSRENIGVMLA